MRLLQKRKTDSIEARPAGCWSLEGGAAMGHLTYAAGRPWSGDRGDRPLRRRGSRAWAIWI